MNEPLARKVRVVAEITLLCPECLQATTYGVDQANVPSEVMCSTVTHHDGDAPVNCGHLFGRQHLVV